MKIGILTQPLRLNYGGLLQNYALQQVLRSQGFDAYTIHHGQDSLLSFTDYIDEGVQCVKKLIKIALGRISYRAFSRKRCEKHTMQFVKRYIQTTEPCRKLTWKLVQKYEFDAYVIGSDQVWRPRYNRNPEALFCSFLPAGHAKRIAYAASFGTDVWEFNPSQTKRVRNLIHFFNAVSVREDAGVKLCKDYLEVDAMHVLDPTMLLSTLHYHRLCDNYPIQPGNLVSFILDSTTQKATYIKRCSQQYGMTVRDISQSKYTEVPPVESWLAAIRDAKLVITDSFHGAVFSILFNRPFVVIPNRNRGIARISSLLKMFELENYQINDIANACLPVETINWNRVNQLLDIRRTEALKFLKQNL